MYKLAAGPINVLAFTRQYHKDISHIFQVSEERRWQIMISTRFKGVASHVYLEQFLDSITGTVGQQ